CDECYFFFFFSSRRRHTRSYGDWSSDVCSSDLGESTPLRRRLEIANYRGGFAPSASVMKSERRSCEPLAREMWPWPVVSSASRKIGRASCRERVEREGVDGV